MKKASNGFSREDILRLLITQDISKNEGAIIVHVVRLLAKGNKKSKKQVSGVLRELVE